MIRLSVNNLRRVAYELRRVLTKHEFYDQRMLLSDRQGLTIFDVGGHVGETVARYKRMFPKATIYSFEPFPESFEKLRARFQRDRSIKPIRAAVSDKVGTTELYVNQLSETNSLFPYPVCGRRYYPKKAETVTNIQVPATTIDDFCGKHSISEVDILKMDIQGAELMALRGAAEKLKQGLIQLIYTEVMFVRHYEEGAMFQEISNFLAAYDYTLFDIYSTFHARNGQLGYGDAVFVSRRIRGEVLDSFKEEL